MNTWSNLGQILQDSYGNWKMQILSFLWSQCLVKWKREHISRPCSFHVAWREPIQCSKGWRQPTRGSGLGSGELWGFFVTATKPTYSVDVSSTFLKNLYDVTSVWCLKFPPFGKLGKWVKGFQSQGMWRNLKQGSICICLVDIVVPNEVIWTSVAYLPRASKIEMTLVTVSTVSLPPFSLGSVPWGHSDTA